MSVIDRAFGDNACSLTTIRLGSEGMRTGSSQLPFLCTPGCLTAHQSMSPKRRFRPFSVSPELSRTKCSGCERSSARSLLDFDRLASQEATPSLLLRRYLRLRRGR
jgi:hypothetical protein